MGNLWYINHSGKYIEINFNMKIPFQRSSMFFRFVGKLPSLPYLLIVFLVRSYFSFSCS